jgi:uncharacterized protein
MKLFLICFVVGIAAQLVDGTLGMAYGVTSGTLLRAMGVPSAVSSFCVHLAEIFTTLVSGISHFKLKNIDKSLFLRLIIPGIIGGVIGAYILTSFDESIISPIVSAYLIIMGVVIFVKAVKMSEKNARVCGKEVYPIAFIGGLSDSIGGGGWGPVVTSTLVASDCDVRKTIGSVNAAEFFVTAAESVMFVMTLGSVGEYLPAVLGLLIGGVIISPVAAYLCKKLPIKPFMAVIGVVIIIINTYKLITALI